MLSFKGNKSRGVVPMRISLIGVVPLLQLLPVHCSQWSLTFESLMKICPDVLQEKNNMLLIVFLLLHLRFLRKLGEACYFLF